MLYISAPFGNYINAGKKNVLSVIGTYTIDPRPGRLTQILKTLRYSFKAQAWYNSLGLRNPGIDSILKKYPLRSNRRANQILSISAIEPNDWRRFHEKIPQSIQLELNISCPNIEKNYHTYIQDLPRFVERNPIVKLSPTMSDEEIKELYDMGFTKFHSCNTLKTIHGARSGDILKPHVIRQINLIKQLNLNNYCIAGGGIQNMKDIIEYKSIGANAFSLGTVCFNPFKLRKIIREYQ